MTSIEFVYASYCRQRFPLPSAAEVAQLEARLDLELPTDYREYILSHNGGYFTEPEITPAMPDCPLDRLTLMHGINATHRTAELGTNSDLALFDDNWPIQVLPVGYTIMGNLIVLITAGEEAGCIVLSAVGGKSYYLAEGIEEFFHLIREPTQD